MFTAAVLCAEYAGTLDLIDTTTLLGHSTTPAPVITVGTKREKIAIGADFFTAPSARLTLRNHRWAYTLSYSPSLAVSDVEVGLSRAERTAITGTGDVFQIVHAGAASATWHDRFVVASLSESGSYGQSFVYQALTSPTQATLDGQTSPVVQPTAPTTIVTPPTTGTPPTTTPSTTSAGANGNVHSGAIDVGSSNTFGNVSMRTGPRTSVSLGGGYSIGGALKSEDQVLLPLQYGWLLTGGFNHTFSRRDNFGISILAQDTTTSGPCAAFAIGGPATGHCVEQSPYGQAQVTLAHRLSALASVAIAAGAGAYEVTTNTVQEVLVLPVCSVTASYSPARGEATFVLGAGLSPTVDLLSGLPSYRLQTTLSVSKPLTHTVTVTVTGGILKSIPAPTSVQSGPNAGFHFEDSDKFIAEIGSVNANVRIDHARTVGFGADELYQYESVNNTVIALGSTDAHVNLGLSRKLAVGAGVIVSWQNLPSNVAVGALAPGAISNAPSVGAYISLTGNVPTLRF